MAENQEIQRLRRELEEALNRERALRESEEHSRAHIELLRNIINRHHDISRFVEAHLNNQEQELLDTIHGANELQQQVVRLDAELVICRRKIH
ncbi:hypothetical protein GCK72_006978 [Caenorhabditis remanei]|uniref:Uncharacterized protein n=1 Tax=Caenorhabditis remanei TaxID=31234 RepID=A0A6A5HGA0_CAERE|nr:hypothetical protein GCK72_006978 [Caenorhabditis remanei]KAF1767020.1 hypothetical protein GCK72_006978 [Caenorhabditis remanei]